MQAVSWGRACCRGAQQRGMDTNSKAARILSKPSSVAPAAVHFYAQARTAKRTPTGTMPQRPGLLAVPVPIWLDSLMVYRLPGGGGVRARIEDGNT